MTNNLAKHVSRHTTQDIENRVLRIVGLQFDLPVDSLSKQTHLRNDLHMCELEAAEIRIQLVDEFAIDIAEEHESQWQTVGDIAAVVLQNAPE